MSCLVADGRLHQFWTVVGLITCEVGGVVQGDEGPVCGVAQVFCHGVIVVVGHQEEGQEEEVEKQGEVEGEEEQLKDHYTWMECGWNDKTSASGLSHVEYDE